MKAVDNTYLKFIDFTKLVNWSSYALLGKNLIYNQKYPFVRIGDFLKRNKEQVTIEDGVLYKRPKIKTNVNGISLRGGKLVDGKKIGTKNQFRIYKDQFLLSKIDARNGAFGVVPIQLDRAVITGNFWTFDVDYNLINPHYLTLLTGTKEFQKLCQTASVGTTNRNYLQEELFLNFEIPLPPLTEQNVLLNNYNRKLQHSEQLQQQVDDLEKGIENYLFDKLGIKRLRKKVFSNKLAIIDFKDLERWDGKNENVLTSKYEVEKIGKYITEISTGTTPPTSRQEYFIGDINFYTPSELGDEMYLSTSERKLNEIAFIDKKARKFKRGTILFVGIGSTVGKVGIIANEFATSNQQITGFNVNQKVLKNEYVYYYFKYFREITTVEQTKATLPIVNQNKIINIPIPIPPIEIQKLIIKKINNFKEQIGSLIANLRNLKLEASLEFEKIIFK